MISMSGYPFFYKFTNKRISNQTFIRCTYYILPAFSLEYSPVLGHKFSCQHKCVEGRDALAYYACHHFAFCRWLVVVCYFHPDVSYKLAAGIQFITQLFFSQLYFFYCIECLHHSFLFVQFNSRLARNLTNGRSISDLRNAKMAMSIIVNAPETIANAHPNPVAGAIQYTIANDR